MSKFDSQRKASFLAGIPTASLESAECTLTKRCKFNEWSAQELVGLFEKLREFSRERLEYWMAQPMGKSGRVLSIYGAFPACSDLVHPKHVPHQVLWGRFRLDWSGRLCGFVVPKDLDGTAHASTGQRFDVNTFYVVFLDRDHCFYKGREQK